MKKILKKAIVMMLSLVLLMSAFNIPAEAALKGYKFKNKGVTVTMNSNAKKFIKKAGKPINYKETKSCAYDGKDRVREYKNFILYTYSNSDNGPEYINGITFLNKKVKTKEGIKIGSKLKKVQKAYGKGTERYGIYTYTKGKTKLQIQVKDGKVSNIRYILKN